MQADRRLVEHVHHAHQAGADLAGQANALRLAARKGVGLAVQRQVVQPHVDQKVQALAHFLENAPGDFAAPAGQIDGVEEVEAAFHRPARDFRQRLVGDEDVARLAPQALAVALRAGPRGDVARQFLAHDARIGLAVALLQVGDDAHEGMLARLRAALGQVAEGDLLAAAAVEDDLLQVLGELLEGRLDIEVVVLGQRLDELEVVGVAPVPAADRAAGQRQFAVGHHPVGVEILLHAQAVAGLAGPVGVVEREQARLELGQAVVADRAGIARREQHFLDAAVGIPRIGVRGRHGRHHGQAVGQGQGGLEALGQALGQVLAHPEAVDDRLDGVLLAQLELWQFVVEVDHLAVDPGAHEPLGAQLLQHLDVLALAVSNDRGEQHQLAALGQVEHRVDHLRDGLGVQFLAVIGAARRAHPGVHQAQVVVNLGHRAHRRARVVAGRLLFDGNCRRQALDAVDIGFLHHRQELPRVGRQRLDVAPLAFRVDGVEGQRGLARARQAREHDQLVTGQFDVDVGQVVGARAADADRLH